jgi:hypothetical protein
MCFSRSIDIISGESMMRRKCVVCKEVFMPRQWQQKCCSLTCARKWKFRYSKHYYKVHEEEHKAWAQAYYKKHRNKHIKDCKTWREKNREYFANYTANIYPKKRVKKLCEKYGFNSETTNAMLRGGKQIDKQLEELKR